MKDLGWSVFWVIVVISMFRKDIIEFVHDVSDAASGVKLEVEYSSEPADKDNTDKGTFSK